MDLVFRKREQMFANAEMNKKPKIDLENKISATKELQNLSLKTNKKQQPYEMEN